MKITSVVLLLAMAPAIAACPEKPVNVSEACAVIKKTLYPNCRFKFSTSEVNALSEENQKKITSVKIFFRQCPQAKACGAK